jgi:PAS domain-containing protein
MLTPILAYVYDLSREHITYVAGSLFEHLGFPPRALGAIGRDFFRLLVHQADRARLAAHQEAMRSQTDDAILEIEYRIRIPSGEWRWLKSRDRPFARDRSGRCVTQILGIVHEIADRSGDGAPRENAETPPETHAPRGAVALASEPRTP